jgi:pilus assembly protein Flp/PilA
MMFLDHIRFIASYVAHRTVKDERGASMVEYALLLALIAVVCIAAVKTLGGAAAQKFTDVSTNVSNP